MIRCLIHLYSPPYLISALAALATLYPARRVSATVLVQLPGATDAVLEEILGVVRVLAGGHGSVERVVGLTDAKADSGSLKDLLGNAFDDFIYAHDATGTICRRLAAAYPKARRICTGDAFGMFYSTDFIDSYRADESFPTALRRWLGGFFRAPPIKPDLAVSALPVDPSGEGLSGIDLICCPKREFQAVVKHCHASATDLRNYMSRLLGKFEGRKCYVLLTEPHSEAGHLSEVHEEQMYVEIVGRYCEPGGVVLIKPHPLESPEKLGRIADALREKAEVVGVEREFSRYPIEIWEEMVSRCGIICSAYPVLSLKFLYDIDVVQPMNDEMIARWIDPPSQRWVRDGLRLYMAPLERLPDWDGKGVLWRGGGV